MIFGVSYCQQSTLSIIINRNTFKVETVVMNDGPDFKSCIDSLNSDEEFRIPTILVEKIATAQKLANVLPTDRKYRVVVFDSPENLMYSGIELIDAKQDENGLWLPIEFNTSEFNTKLLKSDLTSVNEIKLLKERKFNPVKRNIEIASTVVSLKSMSKKTNIKNTNEARYIDSTTCENEIQMNNSNYNSVGDNYYDSENQDISVDNDDSIYEIKEGNVGSLISELNDDILLQSCRYMAGIIDENFSIPEKIVEFGESEYGLRLLSAFIDFYKNDLTSDGVAKKYDCFEDDINILIDNIGDLDNIKFKRQVIYKENNNNNNIIKIKESNNSDVTNDKKDSTATSTNQVTKNNKSVNKNKAKNKVVTPADDIPKIAPVAKPVIISKPKSIVEAIEAAYTNITDSSMERLEEVVSKYLANFKGTTKSSFNAAKRAAEKAGVGTQYLDIIDKMVHSKYGETLLTAYKDILLYNSSESEASKALKVDESDVAMITAYCPVNEAEKERYTKDIPIVLIRKNKGKPQL